MDPQTPTHTGNNHGSSCSDPQPTKSLQTHTGHLLLQFLSLLGPPSLQESTAISFLLNSTGWNCTPAVAVVDGMLTVSSVKILYENHMFSFFPSKITAVKCND